MSGMHAYCMYASSIRRLFVVFMRRIEEGRSWLQADGSRADRGVRRRRKDISFSYSPRRRFLNPLVTSGSSLIPGSQCWQCCFAQNDVVFLSCCIVDVKRCTHPLLRISYVNLLLLRTIASVSQVMWMHMSCIAYSLRSCCSIFHCGFVAAAAVDSMQRVRDSYAMGYTNRARRLTLKCYELWRIDRYIHRSLLIHLHP